jgi:hypothetical protein
LAAVALEVPLLIQMGRLVIILYFLLLLQPAVDMALVTGIFRLERMVVMVARAVVVNTLEQVV